MRAAALLAVAALALGPAAARGDKTPRRKWTSCDLRVDNKTPFRVLVHVDGVYWGWVNAQRAFTFKGIPDGEIVLYGATQYGEFFWGPQKMKCRGTAGWDLSF